MARGGRYRSRRRNDFNLRRSLLPSRPRRKARIKAETATQTPITASGKETASGHRTATADAAISNNPAPNIIRASAGPSGRRLVMAALTVRPIWIAPAAARLELPPAAEARNP
jgi:hypothetical protein